MLISFKQLLDDALSGGYAVGYFELWDVYSLEAVLAAAEAENVLVILGFGGVMMRPSWLDGGGLERLAALGLETARVAKVPVAFLLNEVTDLRPNPAWLAGGFQRSYARLQRPILCRLSASDPSDCPSGARSRCGRRGGVRRAAGRLRRNGWRHRPPTDPAAGRPLRQ